MLNVSRRLKFPQRWLTRLAVNVGVIGLLVNTLTGAQAFAQSAFKPTGPVKIVVMFPPGGGTDAVARIVGERLTDLWQQQVIIENKAGAQGNQRLHSSDLILQRNSCQIARDGFLPLRTTMWGTSAVGN